MKTILLKKVRKEITLCKRGKGNTAIYSVFVPGYGIDSCDITTFEKEEDAREFRRTNILRYSRYLANHTVRYGLNRTQILT